MVDGVPLQPSTTEPNNFITVQPDSGYLYQQKKDSTVYFMLGGQSMSSAANADSGMIASPFPDLDPLYGVQVPFFDIQESMTADADTLTSKLDFIAVSNNQTKTVIITMSVFSAFFLVLGIVALVLHKLMGGNKAPSRDELLENHMNDNDH